jgi:hypothetical protein
MKSKGQEAGEESAGQEARLRTSTAPPGLPHIRRREYQTAHASMMRGMSVPYTGDPDGDFRVQTIAPPRRYRHRAGCPAPRQGPLDPANGRRRHRRATARNRRAAAMAGASGVTPPPGGQPRHIVGANSYPSRRSRELGPSSGGNPGHRNWASRLLGEAPYRSLSGRCSAALSHEGCDGSRQAAHGRTLGAS